MAIINYHYLDQKLMSRSVISEQNLCLAKQINLARPGKFQTRGGILPSLGPAMPPPSPAHGLSASPKPPSKNHQSPSSDSPLLPPAMPIDLADDLQSLSFGSQTVSTTSGSSSSSSSTCESLKPSPSPIIASGADPCLEAIRRIANPDGSIAISDLRFIQRLGSGDIGSVYLAEVKGNGGVVLAAKVMDKKELIGRNKSARAKTEKEILEMLDHPFLPKLYGCAENDRVTSLLTEFCPGGDLHVLRQRQPGKRFDEHAVRFYAAEVVVALEYMHMLGIIYRDLKPENVLVRADGHIMLTDFDLSLKADLGCSPAAQLIRSHQPTLPSSSPHPKDRAATTASTASTAANTNCILPNCIVPGVSCFQPTRSRVKKTNRRGGPAGGLVFVAEPIDLRSMSFVGTHEYLAPEIVSGEGHGSSVDWWTLGVLIFELLWMMERAYMGYGFSYTYCNHAVAAAAVSKAASLVSDSASQNEVVFPVLETVCSTASGFTLPFTVTFCSFKSTSNDSTPEK
ncbi:Protein kinase G11A [Dendrobium catenatum]|uniref:non-specific serine/threonine protein kinase n=1 Tax=Dendrobium catenatum TaxID=906689 RepID=A0A2I0X2L7_9ASPA|nr:Protein kinase G11A [Dendrobium catenatum]